jgi:hypothetical protein
MRRNPSSKRGTAKKDREARRGNQLVKHSLSMPPAAREKWKDRLLINSWQFWTFAAPLIYAFLNYKPKKNLHTEDVVAPVDVNHFTCNSTRHRAHEKQRGISDFIQFNGFTQRCALGMQLNHC